VELEQTLIQVVSLVPSSTSLPAEEDLVEEEVDVECEACSVEAVLSEVKVREPMDKAQAMLGESEEQRLSQYLLKSLQEHQERLSLPLLTSRTTPNSPTSQDASSEVYSPVEQLKFSRTQLYQSISRSLLSKS